MKNIMLTLGLLSLAIIGNAQIKAFALKSSIWKTHEINVCWENPAPSNLEGRRWTQEAVKATWEKESRLRFIGWHPCTDTSKGIRILIQDTVPRTQGLGNTLDGLKNGMRLNFTFNEWKQNCQIKKKYCIKTIAVHEFGHAIGFSHEQNRSDTPNDCDDAQGTDGDWKITPYDPSSVMNYCNFFWGNDGILSTGDIIGVRAMYGHPDHNCVNGDAIKGMVCGDYNDDGKGDVIWTYYYGNDLTRIHGFLSTGSEFIQQGDQGWWTCSAYNGDAIKGMVCGDYDGNGRDDAALVYYYGDNNTTIHALISTADSLSSTGPNFAYQDNRGWFSSDGGMNANAIKGVVSGDYDGDGKDDVAWVYDYGNNHVRIHTFLSTGNSFAYQGNQGWFSSDGGMKADAIKGVVSGDYDGDGKDDVAWVYDYGNNHVRIHTFLSTGHSFAYQGNQGWFSSDGGMKADAIKGVVSGDYDGDGKDDIAWVYDYGNDNAAIHTFLSTGDNFAYQGDRGWFYTTGEVNANAIKGITSGDYDGDEKDDIAWAYYYGNNLVRIHTFLSTGKAFDFQGRKGWWKCD